MARRTTSSRSSKGNTLATGPKISSCASRVPSVTSASTVGATNQRDRRSEYSSYGSALSFVAPSSDIDSDVVTPTTVGTTTTTTIVMYRSAFQNLEFGFGSAIAIVLLLVILVITGLQFLAARKLVFYQ